MARRGAAPVYLRQIANIVDGQQARENVALLNGAPALAIDVVKTQGANTIEVARGVRAAVAEIQKALPPDIRLDIVRDSSRGIQNSVNNVQQTMIEGGLLTIAIVFLFLHSWRSTVIIALSIPLSVLSSLTILSALGETINLMTLGGLALAVGILVDDATVTIENIERHLQMGKHLNQAILDGAGEIGVPAFVATLCICIVFVPMFFLTGIEGRLLTPLAFAYVAALMASLAVAAPLTSTRNICRAPSPSAARR